MFYQVGTVCSYINVFFSAFILAWGLFKFNRRLDGQSPDAKKLVREALRMKLRASWKCGEYALNVSAAGVKIALAREYHLAMLAGMEDFWENVHVFDGAGNGLSSFERYANAHDGEGRLTCIFDGHSKTYTANAVNVVPKHYTCTVATPEEIREVIDHAKSKAESGNDCRSPSGDNICIHACHYTISPCEADALKRELNGSKHQHSEPFMHTVLKLIENARGAN